MPPPSSSIARARARGLIHLLALFVALAVLPVETWAGGGRQVVRPGNARIGNGQLRTQPSQRRAPRYRPQQRQRLQQRPRLQQRLRLQQRSSESRLVLAAQPARQFDVQKVNGLRDQALVSKLAELVRPNLLGYRPARRWLFEVVDNHNGSVTGLYTGRQATGIRGIPSATEGARMNTEHVTPQSELRRNGVGQLRSDLHILAANDTEANTARGNLPFGEVRNENWSKDGSRRGRDATGAQVFEPRDASKGVVARMRFYAALLGNPIPANEEAVLRRWHTQFPPTAAERARTERVARTPQGNVNPFVTNPELVDRISDL